MGWNSFWSASIFIVRTYFAQHTSQSSSSDIDIENEWHQNDNILYKACANWKLNKNIKDNQINGNTGKSNLISSTRFSNQI